MIDQIANFIIALADFVCGYPLFILLIGGGLYLFISSGAVSLRRIPQSVRALRQNSGNSTTGEISSLQALLSAVAGTVGLGSIAGVAIALVVGGPGAIFWMWISSIVGMSTKFHEATLAIMYKGKDKDGHPRGGMMYVIEQALGEKWRPLAKTFAIAGLFGTMCIINANQLTEAVVTMCDVPNSIIAKLIFGIIMASIVAIVVLRGVTRIARVASILVPFMVGIYFIMVLYIIITHIGEVPNVVKSIFYEAFNLKAGIGALAGIALVGARRAALVNDAGIGTASIMHGASRNTNAVREGLVAMLGPAIDSGFVCTLTAVALMLCGDFTSVQGVKGLQVALAAFDSAVPAGAYLLMIVVTCFAMSSMFSYSYYGTCCATYLFGESRARYYTIAYILSLVFFAVVPLEAAVSCCDFFYACMAFPTMLTLILLSKRVRIISRQYFSKTNTNI
jgi:AGCS family alanine or glycine:cation symporter